MWRKIVTFASIIIIVLDKRTTTMIRTNRLLIDRFMFIAISDAGCSDIDNQCVMSPPHVFRIVYRACRHLYNSMAYRFFGMPFVVWSIVIKEMTAYFDLTKHGVVFQVKSGETLYCGWRKETDEVK